MSTEHQQYSTENQAAAILRYAESRGMEIVRTYLDAGKRGVRLSNRLGLRTLLRDVETGQANYKAILVYDVSRWGRFQDGDESAYYEYICKQAGVRVHYCAEQFENDGSIPSSLMKTIKRVMAGEFSRELSAKVFAGQCRIVELGFHQGGRPMIGFRRQMVDKYGNPKGLLADGERKNLQTDHVILVPGPPKEVRLVQDIFNAFTREGKSETEIAASLNARGILNAVGHPWNRWHVHYILTSPKYAGTNVWNRKSFKVNSVHVKNPPELWVRRDNAFAPLITMEQFRKAQTIIQERLLHYTQESLLDKLKRLLKRHGRLSLNLIDEAKDMPAASTYIHFFNGICHAYQLIGYKPSRKYRYIESAKALRSLYSEHLAKIVRELRERGAHVEQHPKKAGLMKINHELTALFVLVHCTKTRAGNRWIRQLTSHSPDVTIVARVAPTNDKILDYYLLPRTVLPLVVKPKRLQLGGVYKSPLVHYRFDDLNLFMKMAGRVTIKEAI